MARRDAAGVRLLTRRGNDWTALYPSIAAAVAALPCRSCLIDGEGVICGEDGVPVFDRLRYGRQPPAEAVLFAFDLLELGGNDLRRSPLGDGKRALFKLLRTARWALPSTYRRARRHRIPSCLQARLRGYRQQAGRLALCLRPFAALDQEQEPKAPGGEAGGGRGLAPLTSLTLKRASASQPSGVWNEVVGRVFKAEAAPAGCGRCCLITAGRRTATAAMAAFAKSWRRE
jgi:hypothetical protein